MPDIYVSMTGFRVSRFYRWPTFVWRTLTSIAQARNATGNLDVQLRLVGSTYHTLTMWMDERSMRNFVQSGAHRRAMVNFRTLGSGKTFGYTCAHKPDWNTVYRLWRIHAKDV